MLRVIILPAAEQDIVDLGRALLERAGRIISDAMVELLGEFPRIGIPREDFRPGTRVSAARPYLIFHTIADDTVVVLRVLHGARDIKPEMLP